MTKRLIEHRLPLLEVSTESAREKSIRHGHISTLHIWWARRPLAASRAAVFATLAPDTDENYELVKKIAPWEAVKDGNSEAVLKARQKILEANNGVPPKVLDPFAGGDAIPLEALRLGCETYALDLNPVAHIIQRATLEYPQKFGQPTTRPAPAHIRAKDAMKSEKNHQSSAFEEGEGEWARAYAQNPLATEVRYWGEWVLERAKADLAAFYPADADGKTPVAYLWARTVTCVNPACRAEVPMVRQWWLAKKSNKRIALRPVVDAEAKTVSFEVVEGVGAKETWPDEGTITRGNATCPVCSSVVPVENVRESARDESWGERLLTVVLTDPDESGKSYRAATSADEEIFAEAKARLEQLQAQHQDPVSLVPDEELPPVGTLGFRVNNYGIKKWGQLFNPRQALSLVTFAKWVREAHGVMLGEGLEEEEARGVATYLGLAVNKLADYTSTLCTWHYHNREKVSHTFTRQALPMVWDYVEINPTERASGDWQGSFYWYKLAFNNLAFETSSDAHILRGSATRIPLKDNFLDAIITDPPYYDAVPYADLSDFFYVWLKRTVGHLYPAEFRTPLTPKAQEAVQNPVRHGGNNDKAKAFFEGMMAQAFSEMHRVLKPEGEATIVFAHKSTDAWETLINALIKAGFRVEASWPLHTEMATRLRARGSAALASSTFLNCTKRAAGEVGYFNGVRAEMQDAIRPQLEEFWASGIRGADFFMSAIGPGLASYSRYDEVRRASGEPVGVGEFLDEVRKIVMEFALSQVMAERRTQERLDEPTQFALLTLWAYGYELPSDEARKLAQGVGVELDGELQDVYKLVSVKGPNAELLSAKKRLRGDGGLGMPSAKVPQVPLVDAMHRAITLLPEGRQALSDYLGAVSYLDAESFWRTTQAFAEILHEEEEGRALDELLTLRDNLPKPTVAAQGGLF